jgi:hypothetical protein
MGNRLARWSDEIRRGERSFSDGFMNKAGHLVRKVTKTTLWATKSYEVWLLLLNLLFLVKPKKILELGSGRSTNYLAEYAGKLNAELISIEHNWYYYIKVKSGLKLLFLDTEYLKYVPVYGDWYDIKKLDRFLSGYNNIEFLFIDGPTNTPDDIRDPDIFYAYMADKIKDIRMILIDDTHFELGKRAANRITSQFGLSRFEVEYFAGPHRNKLAILLDPVLITKLDDLPDYLGGMLVRI